MHFNFDSRFTRLWKRHPQTGICFSKIESPYGNECAILPKRRSITRCPPVYNRFERFALQAVRPTPPGRIPIVGKTDFNNGKPTVNLDKKPRDKSGGLPIFRAPCRDPIVQRPRTPPFHGGNRGSNPRRVAILFSRFSERICKTAESLNDSVVMGLSENRKPTHRPPSRPRPRRQPEIEKEDEHDDEDDRCPGHFPTASSTLGWTHLSTESWKDDRSTGTGRYTGSRVSLWSGHRRIRHGCWAFHRRTLCRPSGACSFFWL